MGHMLDARADHLGADDRAAFAVPVNPHEPLVLSHDTRAALVTE